jgi:hypothetical protein
MTVGWLFFRITSLLCITHYQKVMLTAGYMWYVVYFNATMRKKYCREGLFYFFLKLLPNLQFRMSNRDTSSPAATVLGNFGGISCAMF